LACALSNLKAGVLEVLHYRSSAFVQFVGRSEIADQVFVGGDFSPLVFDVRHFEVGFPHFAFLLVHLVCFGFDVVCRNFVGNQVFPCVGHVLGGTVPEMKMSSLEIVLLILCGRQHYFSLSV